MRASRPAALLALLALSTPAAASDTGAIDAVVDRNMAGLEGLYQNIHAHPELSLKEDGTAALLARTMRDLGLEVTEHVGGTGVVAILRNGAGPTVLIRTELDALPMQEKTGLPYASTVQVPYGGAKSFVAHSCGHDVHMASWVGAAQALLALRRQWTGTVLFVGQPGEEGGRGARAMVEGGLFTRFPKPDYGFAVHVENQPVGTIEVKAGIVSSSNDAVRITFIGRGAHGSVPSQSIDPVVMGAHFVTDVQAVAAREKDAEQFGVVTVGAFQAGTVGNIIPDRAELALSLRSFTPEVRATLLRGVKRTAEAVASMAGAPAPQIVVAEGAPAVVNDPRLARSVAAALKESRAGDITEIPETEPGFAASEDYSDLVVASGMRSVYFSIGSYDPQVIATFKAQGKILPTNHSPDFAPDVRGTVRHAVRALVIGVLSVLPPPLR